MPVKLYGLDSVGISTTSQAEFSFPVDTSYPIIKVIVQKISGDADPDIYVANGYPPTIYSYDYFSTLLGDNETLEINNVELGTHSGIVTSFSGTGRVSINVYGYYLAEIGAGDPIDDINNDVGNDIINIGGDLNNKIGTVTVTINQDMSGIVQAINAIDEKVGAAVSNSIDELAAKIAGAVTGVGDLNKQQLIGVGNSLERSYNNVGIAVGQDLNDLGTDLSIALRSTGNTINDGLSELGNNIYSKVGEPSLIILKDLSDNVKGISHGVIDDVLMSIFEKVE
jgi:hypothetical protein